MMQRCCSSQGNMVGPCSCGSSSCNSFSMLFSMPNQYKSCYDVEVPDLYCSSSSSSSSVDCTLSLGTPSTRLCSDAEDERRSIRHERRPSMSNFCWDIFQSKNNPPNYNATSYGYSKSSSTASRGGNNAATGGNNNGLANNDPLLARRCANCDTTSTPLWRNGPRGPKSLCNACGIRFKKEERRATAANANGNQSGVVMDHQQQYGYQNNSWVQSQKMACFSPAANEFRFIDDNDRDSDSGIPFLSWRLNVTDRPGLVHDFTR